MKARFQVQYYRAELVCSVSKHKKYFLFHEWSIFKVFTNLMNKTSSNHIFYHMVKTFGKTKEIHALHSLLLFSRY